MSASQRPSLPRRTALTAPTSLPVGLTSSTRAITAILCGIVTIKPSRLPMVLRPATPAARSAGAMRIGTSTASTLLRAMIGLNTRGEPTCRIGSPMMA